jgi:hypothetical protein
VFLIDDKIKGLLQFHPQLVLLYCLQKAFGRNTMPVAFFGENGENVTMSPRHYLYFHVNVNNLLASVVGSVVVVAGNRSVSSASSAYHWNSKRKGMEITNATE